MRAGVGPDFTGGFAARLQMIFFLPSKATHFLYTMRSFPLISNDSEHNPSTDYGRELICSKTNNLLKNDEQIIDVQNSVLYNTGRK